MNGDVGATSQLLRDSGLDAVIGMYPVVHRLRTTVIAPWASSIAGDPVVRPPRRVLVHGPEGCGVTYIAERLADELSAFDVSAIVVRSLDDDLRDSPDDVAAVLEAPATRDVVVIGISHRPWDIPSTLFAPADHWTGPGSPTPASEHGFERLAFVPPPDWDARRFRVWETPWGGSMEVTDLDHIVASTEGWSGADIAALAYAAGDDPDELAALLEAGPAAAGAWLAKARTMIHSFGYNGRVDDLVGYLQRYRLI